MYSPQDKQKIYQQAKSLLANADLQNPTSIPLLKEVILYADWSYYVESEPLLSDQEYDLLFTALKKIEKAHPSLLTDDSPTQRVAYGISERLPTVPHLVPMLSLDNTYNAEDLQDWAKRCAGLVTD
ncbi:MAG: hypothetical protein IT256_03840 [Chitinophagaceae bacterium]|nr:hypothetical protein [Chitinophagaceae bacterium]